MNALPPITFPRFFMPALFFVLASVQTWNSLDGQIIYQNNFNQHRQPRTYTEDDLDNEWNNQGKFEDGVREGRVSIVRGSEAWRGTGSSLAVEYPANQYGTKRTGAQWKFEFGGEYEEVVLSYKIKFKNGFDFVRGGKLPGLAGGTAPTGSRPANGTNGWTARMMWRTDFQGQSGNPEQLVANGISYAKHVDSGFDGSGDQEDKLYWTDNGGEANGGPLTILQSGVWYDIKQRVKMNTPNQFDGVIQIWLNGQLVHDQKDVRFRTTSDLKIDKIYFSTFFGGGSSWATSKDETVYFDNFKIVVPTPKTVFRKVPQAYANIQSAIDASNPGDIVAVRGTQTGNFLLNKNILLRGYRGAKIIAANPDIPAVKITHPGAHLKRFEITGGGVVVNPGNPGVTIDYVDVHDAVTGIFLSAGCDGTLIRKCETDSNLVEGFFIYNSDDVTLDRNESYDNGGTGFVFVETDGLIATKNRSEENGSNGFWFGPQTSNSIVVDNKANDNSAYGYEDLGSNSAFIDNDCSGNGSGGSNPPGLCD